MIARTILLILACLAACASAQGPRMAVRGTETILAIDTAEITIRAHGGIAETEMLLTFRNPTSRPVEGEFSLPLPPGATISSYALEVNGTLREAVAVEKQRALHAYETIKRQNIDPGIVERQAGNVYRTRVFPIPARGTKQLRIGYVETLPLNSNNFIYQCPLEFHPAPARISFHISNSTNPRWSGTPDLAFARQSGGHTLELENTAIQGTLEITQPMPANGMLHAESGNAPLFFWCGRFPEIPEQPRPSPKRILLFLDASEATLDHDPTATFALLDKWFAKLGNLDVELHFLRDRATPGGVHSISNGDWKTLRHAIESADRDGSHSLLDLTDSDSDAVDLILYCGTGHATASPRIGEVGQPLIVIHSGSNPPANALADAARRTGGAIIAADQMKSAGAMRLLLQNPFRVHSIHGRTDGFQLIGDAAPRPGDLIRLIGRWPGTFPRTLDIAFASGSEIHTRITLPGAIIDDHDILRRLHAQHTLATLEAAPVPDPAAILAHCRTHNLASDSTSLIVLERFEDHVQYEIPPPEPDQLALYQAAIHEKHSRQPEFADVWQRHRNFHHHPHPGEEILILPRARQIATWRNAVSSVFAPEEIDQAAVSSIVAWQDDALALAKRRDELQSAADHAAWREAIDAADDSGRKLAATPIQPPPSGKPLAVSVRGIVRDPGVVRAESGLTLLQSIELAGGPLLEPTPHLVALYRNAGKTLYNVKSQEFRDPPLLPGDMIVLEMPYESHEFDGFRMPTPPPHEQPAIIRQHDVWPSLSPHGMNPFGGLPLANPPPAIEIPDPSTAKPPDLENFTRQLTAGADPHAAYREIKGHHRYPVSFHIDAARLLAIHGHPELAATVISTLVSRGRGHLPSRLAEAFWLADFGLHEIAAARLAEPTDSEASPALAYARAMLAKNPTSTRQLRKAIDAQGTAAFSLIATKDTAHLAPIEADIRIVVQSSDTTRPPDINVRDPLGEIVMPHTSTSRTGGRITAAPGLSEFIIRRALPGTYTLSARSATEVTLRVTLHTADSHHPIHQTHHLPPAAHHTPLKSVDWHFR